MDRISSQGRKMAVLTNLQIYVDNFYADTRTQDPITYINKLKHLVPRT